MVINNQEPDSGGKEGVLAVIAIAVVLFFVIRIYADYVTKTGQATKPPDASRERPYTTRRDVRNNEFDAAPESEYSDRQDERGRRQSPPPPRANPNDDISADQTPDETPVRPHRRKMPDEPPVEPSRNWQSDDTLAVAPPVRRGRILADTTVPARLSERPPSRSSRDEFASESPRDRFAGRVIADRTIAPEPAMRPRRPALTESTVSPLLAERRPIRTLPGRIVSERAPDLSDGLVNEPAPAMRRRVVSARSAELSGRVIGEQGPDVSGRAATQRPRDLTGRIVSDRSPDLPATFSPGRAVAARRTSLTPPRPRPISDEVPADGSQTLRASASRSLRTTLFRAPEPYPFDIDDVQIGDTLSEINRMNLSGGRLSKSVYSYRPESGPFKTVYAMLASGSSDPVVTSVVYLLRDSRALAQVRRQAIDAFGEGDTFVTDGAQVRQWPHLQGYTLTLERDRYTVEQDNSTVRGRGSRRSGDGFPE